MQRSMAGLVGLSVLSSVVQVRASHGSVGLMSRGWTAAVKSRRAALQLPATRPSRPPRSLATRPAPDLHAGAPHLRGLAARHQRLLRPGLRDPDRAAVVGPTHPGAHPRRRLLLAVAPGGGHLVAVPIAFVFNLFLDRFISGFTIGAVKG
jgi:hypothetical protein